jgi:hypothetical protein
MVPEIWRSAICVPLPKKHPPQKIQNDIRPIALTAITAKAFEHVVLDMMWPYIVDKIDPDQFGSIPGTCTRDALVKLFHKWYEATDKLNHYIRILLLDYSKAFDHIDINLLVNKLENMEVPPVLVRWMAAFLFERRQHV